MTKLYWWVIITYILTIFSVIIFAPILYFIFPIDVLEATIYWNIISFILGLIIILYLMRPAIRQENTRNKENITTSGIILWSILGVFLAFFAQSIAVMIETELLGIKPGSENTQMIMDITRSSPLFMIIPMLIAPVLEEIVFRKIIFGTLYQKTNFFIAAVLSAFIFGIIHGEPVHLLIYASMGLVFAYVYVKTKRIIVPIIVHMSLNTITVIAQLSLSPEEIERQLEQLQTFIGG